jgi:plastocyanin domain-containing protein
MGYCSVVKGLREQDVIQLFAVNLQLAINDVLVIDDSSHNLKFVNDKLKNYKNALTQAIDEVQVQTDVGYQPICMNDYSNVKERILRSVPNFFLSETSKSSTNQLFLDLALN